MVKIFVKNEKLYLERAGKATELESVTIYHFKTDNTYKLIVFPQYESTSFLKRGQTLLQKKYPLVSITLKKVQDKHITTGKPFYHLKTKNYYINYYVS